MSDNQQRILGYFIEEAKEHLETLENGLLNLSTASEDSEQVDDLFRAAHSIKGGGAMLGYGSIQKTAHRLEDAFKVFRDGTVNVDEKLESLFLSAFDVLKDLITRLESPEGLSEAQGKELVKGAESQFKELQQHLDQCADVEAVIADIGDNSNQEETETIAAPAQAETATPLAEIRPLLREMLQLFRGEDNAETRETLWNTCDRAKNLAPDHANWTKLVETGKSAIANPKHSYNTLAPVVIQELKQGADCLELDQPEQINISDTLKSLANTPTPQVLIPAEPEAAAALLKRIFNQQQLSQLREKISV
ncbi:putative CheA signal transduction histidine kinase [Halothece sp. PCC 7418]|uniref:Hpt domain-containing protein n=1 Tax=Halothece sp. (strain PCC 7418) TaxID=65093 RepID=UPI0002A05BA4|nr:Hpt domain-containing protein [Halothece sp. PCC 7418]AFZ45398.1 putative CheA signal transduction histidine kinase [Halothece sp. PCC 7418]